ncbi:hypothetical protein [Maritalea sp. S77]|uniref:hypothetical protein n=1 Tax=Maritalea sp. S77 TaxID=3415125 RepID=UPI003C7CDF47
MPRLPTIVALFAVVTISEVTANEQPGVVPMLATESALGLVAEKATPPPTLIFAQNKTETKPSKSAPKKSDNRNLPPPVLKKENEDLGEPVHDVRKDVSYIPIEQLEALHQRRKNPDKHSMDPAAVEKEYDKLYRKLQSERKALTKTALELKPGRVKTETLEQAYRLSERLNKLSLPTSSKPGEFPGWRPISDPIENLYDYSGSVDFEIRMAGKAINSADKLAAIRELKKLHEHVKYAKEKLLDVDNMTRDFIDTGIIERVYGQQDAKAVIDAVERQKAQERKLENYIRDYEKALERKWPTPQIPVENPQSLVPGIEPLPKVIDMAPEIFVAPCDNANKC